MSKEYIVKSAFRDKETKKHHAVGSVYESDVVERVTSLQEKGFLETEPVETGKADEESEDKKNEAEAKKKAKADAKAKAEAEKKAKEEEANKQESDQSSKE